MWGNQQTIVTAGGRLGSLDAAHGAGAPDGYTLMLCQIASHAITPARAKKLPFDPIRDFAFVSMVGTTPNVIVTHPTMAMRNLKDVIAYARKNPGKLNYGSAGVGAARNLSVELLKLEAKINIVHVPYRGAALAMADVMSGHLELMTGNLPGPLPMIKAGKVRALAVTSRARNSRVPDIPTVAEQGLPGFDVSSWYGICTQSAVPKPIFDKLRADLLKAMDSADTKRRMFDAGIDPDVDAGRIRRHVKAAPGPAWCAKQHSSKREHERIIGIAALLACGAHAQGTSTTKPIHRRRPRPRAPATRSRACSSSRCQTFKPAGGRRDAAGRRLCHRHGDRRATAPTPCSSRCPASRYAVDQRSCRTSRCVVLPRSRRINQPISSVHPSVPATSARPDRAREERQASSFASSGIGASHLTVGFFS